MSEQLSSSKITLKVDSQVRHDLRTPLNQIIGYSEMLTEDATSRGQEDFLPDLRKITAAACKLVELIDTIFEMRPLDTRQALADSRQQQTLSLTTELNIPIVTLTGKILVVDDNEINLDLISRRLQRQGHQMITARDGHQAMERLYNESFDLVLLDVMMPEMDGYEVLAQMKINPLLRDIPVIMISALTEMDSVVKCIEMGAEDYLPKPFNPTLLRARVSASLEKKRFREQERRYREESMRNEATLERHRSLAQMVAGVAHEINTPLGIASTALSIIDKRLATPHIAELFNSSTDDKETLEDILDATKLLTNNVHRAHKLVENFKKISVSQVTEVKETVDLPKLIADTIDLFKINARQAKLIINIDTSSLTGRREWHGYPGYFTQVLMNFLQNIERYAYPDNQGGNVDIALTDNGDKEFNISVRDYGKGIHPENVAKVFDPFFTTGRGKGGSGLGLAIVHNIVTTALNGKIEVCSELGKGTEFTLHFPKVLSAESVTRQY